MEVLRICGPSILGKFWNKHHSEYLVAKYIIILGFKVLLIFDEAHRKKFYLHTFLLEGSIICIALLLDYFGQSNVCIIFI